MKKILFFFCFAFVSCNSGLQFLNKFDGFNGKPKEVKTTTYRVKYEDSIPTKNLAYMNIDFYDSKGKKIKTLMYKSDGSRSTGGTYYKFDKNGNLIRSIMFNRDSTVNIEIDYKYDDYGNQIEKTYSSEFRRFTTKTIYNRATGTAKIIGEYSDGSFKENAVLEFNDKWNEKELISYDSTGIQTNRIEFFYDSEENKIQSKWFNAKNELTSYYNSNYNSKGDRISIEKYKIKNGKPELTDDTKIEYEYDEKNNFIEKRLIHNGKITFITKYEYSYVW
ncbi:hypothetical protein [Salegentibacter mishustinae]|uniref:DUF4595 domain-containing protein n=1 Tax=Salegentibacter mishustinae TaxID=270918 RepID=A0A0Q9ZPK5_9FLAO|nr:hypothetical protein [Salegentibacter mishustinae]KRG30547.1 hypothetical protein APR42_01385 [Salegentibacter mishustinae]PNW23438.1 hypothetical protein APB85_01380 [Salegentibacter mishustinae]PZX66505.1 hypothetical protein LY54_00903 [Salegentibacter mishustinae]